MSSFSPQEFVSLGKIADELGYSSIWVADHLTDMPPSGDMVDPWTILGAIAVQTRRAELFTGVTDAVRIHPAKLANIIATLDELSAGRAGLGIGAGEFMNLAPYGMPWDNAEARRSRLNEAIIVIKMLLSSSLQNPVSFEGRFYRLHNARIDQKPVHPIRVFVGSLGGVQTLKLLAKIADGWMPSFNSLESFKRRSGIIDNSARSNNREPRDISKVFNGATILTEDKSTEKKAIDALKPLLLVLARSLIVKEVGPEVLDMKRFDESNLSYQEMDPTEESIIIASRIAERIPDDVVRKFALIGNLDQIEENVHEFVSAGATEVVLWDVVAAMQPINKGAYFSDYMRKVAKKFDITAIPLH